MHIGIGELIFIGILILALIRPEKLKDYAKTAGHVIRQVRDEKKDLEEILSEEEENTNITQE